MQAEPTEFLRVSYSSMNTFAGCPRKFEFQKLYPKRERVWDDTYAADVGKALHAGYQDYLIHGNREQAIWKLMLEFPYLGEFAQTNDYRSFDAALATLEEMFESARMEDWELAKIIRPPSPREIADATAAGEIATGQVVPAIEVPFEIRFKGLRLPDGRGIAFTGFIDAIMQNRWSQIFRTLDIKTTRVSLADATPKFKFDSQQVPYGIVVDHVAQDSVESFEVLYFDCYVDLLAPTAKLYPFTKTREDIQEWCTNKLIQFQSIARFLGADYFPRTDSGCLHWNKACAYLEPCMSRDRAGLTEWFLLGEEPKVEEPFHPWIVATIDMGGGEG